MFCTKCGNNIPDGVMFCTYCGNAVKAPVYKEAVHQGAQQQGFNHQGAQQQGFNHQGAQQQGFNQRGPQQGFGQQAGSQMGQQPKPLTAEQKKLFKTVGIICAVVIVLSLAVLLFFNLFWTPTVNLNKYVSITSEGYDSIGSASAKFMLEDFTRDYGNKIKFKGASMPDNASSYSCPAEYMFSNYISGSLNNSSNLSNGETITFEWNVDETSIADSFKVKLKYENIDYAVSGLKKADTFDIFSKVNVTFEGSSPNGTVSITNENDDYPVSYWSFVADKDSGLSNGDKITVSVDGDDAMIQECLNETGMIPDSLSKEYEVSGLDSNITKLEQIPDDIMQKMKKQVEDKLESTAASDWEKGIDISKMTYAGAYLLTAKEGVDSEYNNRVILVYAVDVSADTEIDDTNYTGKFGYYYYGEFSNLVLLDDGTVSLDLNNIETPRETVELNTHVESWWSEVVYNFDGYSDLDTLFNKTVVAFKDQYEYESSVDDSIAPQKASGEASSKKVSSGGEIFPDSSSRLLSESEVSRLSKADVQTAINEIYARNGYKFKDKSILAYFEGYDWYDPDTTSQDVAKSRFNSTENANVLLLSEYK